MAYKMLPLSKYLGDLHCPDLPPVFTFHWSTSVFLVPLAFLGGLGGSGSQLKVVKLTDSDGLPCKQLHMAWTLK